MEEYQRICGNISECLRILKNTSEYFLTFRIIENINTKLYKNYYYIIIISFCNRSNYFEFCKLKLVNRSLLFVKLKKGIFGSQFAERSLNFSPVFRSVSNIHNKRNPVDIPMYDLRILLSECTLRSIIERNGTEEDHLPILFVHSIYSSLSVF